MPTMSGRLCIAIRLGYQQTIAKSLVKPDLHMDQPIALEVRCFSPEFKKCAES